MTVDMRVSPGCGGLTGYWVAVICLYILWMYFSVFRLLKSGPYLIVGWRKYVFAGESDI
jgi:hypothetical protein